MGISCSSMKAKAVKPANREDYRFLCCSLVRIILSKDGYRLVYIDPSMFQADAFGPELKKLNCAKPEDIPEGTAFAAQKGGRKILFFFDDQDRKLLARAAADVAEKDNGEFKNICVMIVKDAVEDKIDPNAMKSRRGLSGADEWRRGFFLSFSGLAQKAAELNRSGYDKLNVRIPGTHPSKVAKIRTLTIDVKENVPVGNKTADHYKLAFETDGGFNIAPGQFIMLSTAPQKREKAAGFTTWDDLGKAPGITAPESYLKRPFGIHRAFYPNFEKDYLKKLSLPPALASVLHTAFPNRFEIFYKVQPNGIGTQELTGIGRGKTAGKRNRLQLVGPLGKGVDIREISSLGFEEIHVIGGGVGMAPLIFICQALRFYSYPVKVFMGLQNLGMLKYADELSRSFEEKDAAIYIDDLSDLGIEKKDIRVSVLDAGENEKAIPRVNFYKGLVTNQYSGFLKSSWSRKKTLAFACGPTGMMKTLDRITTEYGVRLKVLMEKRMACGIGVCLSCVCETKKEAGEVGYSRVCADGPVFDAGEIVWK